MHERYLKSQLAKAQTSARHYANLRPPNRPAVLAWSSLAQICQTLLENPPVEYRDVMSKRHSPDEKPATNPVFMWALLKGHDKPKWVIAYYREGHGWDADSKGIIEQPIFWITPPNVSEEIPE